MDGAVPNIQQNLNKFGLLLMFVVGGRRVSFSKAVLDNRILYRTYDCICSIVASPNPVSAEAGWFPQRSSLGVTASAFSRPLEPSSLGSDWFVIPDPVWRGALSHPAQSINRGWGDRIAFLSQKRGRYFIGERFILIDFGGV